MSQFNLKKLLTNGVGKQQRPQTEVTPKAKRRRFSPAYKLQILEEADHCNKPGQIGALLRREGLYSSHLALWRRQREQGQQEALSAKTPGPKPASDMVMAQELAQLRKEKQPLEQKLKKAELIIEVQKKVSLLLGLDPVSEVIS